MGAGNPHAAQWPHLPAGLPPVAVVGQRVDVLPSGVEGVQEMPQPCGKDYQEIAKEGIG